MDRSVSVIIPTHDRRDVVRRAIDSVLRQTHAPHEVIVVDDGSTDGTGSDLTRDYPEIVVLRQQNRGVSAARNAGIAQASGEWIAFLDSDDEWLPEKLQRQVDLVAGDADAVLCHCDEIWIRDGKRVNPGKRHAKSGGRIFRACLPLCAISPSASLIRRTLFDDVGLFDEGLPACEDYDMWLRVCSRYPVHFVDEALVVKYGGHEDQLSRRYWGMDRWRIEALEKIINAGVLDAADREAAVKMLIEKIDVYLIGARKREKDDEVAAFEKKRKRAKRILKD